MLVSEAFGLQCGSKDACSELPEAAQAALAKNPDGCCHAWPMPYSCGKTKEHSWKASKWVNIPIAHSFQDGLTASNPLKRKALMPDLMRASGSDLAS